jgi:hypothetical protein
MAQTRKIASRRFIRGFYPPDAARLQPVAHCLPRGILGRRFDEDRIAARAVELAQRGVELARVASASRGIRNQ